MNSLAEVTPLTGKATLHEHQLAGRGSILLFHPLARGNSTYTIDSMQLTGPTASYFLFYRGRHRVRLRRQSLRVVYCSRRGINSYGLISREGVFIVLALL
nr:hypothetical protein Q903MT_gene147 [Picea sitchensis]